MPFRLFEASPKDPLKQAPAPEHPSRWRTGLLLVTSAACGGIAVAIWNRRTLALMRQHSEHPGDATEEPASQEAGPV